MAFIVNKCHSNNNNNNNNNNSNKNKNRMGQKQINFKVSNSCVMYAMSPSV